MGIGGEDETAFAFSGDWKEFAPIALTNGLLNIVTLSFYRFWATTRERHYLWSHTRFIDDQLEWTGTGLELLKGFLMALLIFGLPWLFLSFGMQALILQDMGGLAAFIAFLAFFFLFSLVGFAQFRALRYRLSRTEWHGIRGGSDTSGVGYAVEAVWRTILGYLPLTLMLPWAQTRLWQSRWSQMSFGPHAFESNPSWEKMLGRYVLCAVIGPVALIILMVVVIGGSVAAAMASGAGEGFGIGMGIVGALIFYAAFFILPIAYYAAFFREGVSTMSLSTLEFEFTARTKDWIILFLGHGGLWLLALLVAGLIAAPFGALAAFAGLQPGDEPPLMAVLGLSVAFLIPFSLVMPFIRYRNWRFFIRHLEAGGEINLATLTQSTTARETQGEGLIDALDIGAF